MTAFNQLYQKVKINLEQNLPSYLTYHNFDHTQYVLEKTIEIAKKENISEQDLLLVKIAALYHDTGFIINPENHESIGCQIAGNDLRESGFDEDDIVKICNMIMATHIPQQPKTLLEKILADADLEYLGTDNFKDYGQKLFKELLHFNPDLSIKNWNDIQIEFISQHSFHTDYCRKYREPRKIKNLEEVKKDCFLFKI